MNISMTNEMSGVILMTNKISREMSMQFSFDVPVVEAGLGKVRVTKTRRIKRVTKDGRTRVTKT